MISGTKAAFKSFVFKLYALPSFTCYDKYWIKPVDYSSSVKDPFYKQDLINKHDIITKKLFRKFWIYQLKY